MSMLQFHRQLHVLDGISEQLIGNDYIGFCVELTGTQLIIRVCHKVHYF